MPIINRPDATGTELLAECLELILRNGAPKVQVLVARGEGTPTINKMRVALSRSRGRNRHKNRKIIHFKLSHTIYPYTDEHGARFDALVISIQKNRRHRALELVDTMLDKDIFTGGSISVA